MKSCCIIKYLSTNNKLWSGLLTVSYYTTYSLSVYYLPYLTSCGHPPYAFMKDKSNKFMRSTGPGVRKNPCVSSWEYNIIKCQRSLYVVTPLHGYCSHVKNFKREMVFDCMEGKGKIPNCSV